MLILTPSLEFMAYVIRINLLKRTVNVSKEKMKLILSINCVFETFVLLGIEYGKQKYVPKWTEQENWNNLILINRAIRIKVYCT